MIFPGLKQPPCYSQSIFRSVLKAMSEPATVTCVDHVDSWGELNVASVGILLSLCDHNTNIFFSDSLLSDDISKSTQFHTQSMLTDSQSADFAFIKSDDFGASDFHHGNEKYPEKSATVVIQIESLISGKKLSVLGPGIQKDKIVSPYISDDLQQYYRNQITCYPLGIDTILTCGNELMAIPRTTVVQEIT